MSEGDEQIEQITKEPERQAKHIKDPKRVAAGKRLVEYHKRAKQALENEKRRESEKEEEGSSSWIPELSLPVILSLVGITLTAVDLLLRSRGREEVEWKAPPTIHHEENKVPSRPRIEMV